MENAKLKCMVCGHPWPDALPVDGQQDAACSNCGTKTAFNNVFWINGQRVSREEFERVMAADWPPRQMAQALEGILETTRGLEEIFRRHWARPWWKRLLGIS